MQNVLVYFVAVVVDELTLLASLVFQPDSSHSQF